MRWGRLKEEDSLHTVCLQLYLDVIEAYQPEMSETLGLHLGLDIQGLVSSGLFLEICSYPRLGLSLDHQQFPSLGLETETVF